MAGDLRPPHIQHLVRQDGTPPVGGSQAEPPKKIVYIGKPPKLNRNHHGRAL